MRRGKGEAEVKLGLCNMAFRVDRERIESQVPHVRREKKTEQSQKNIGYTTQKRDGERRTQDRVKNVTKKPRWREMEEADKTSAHANMFELTSTLCAF